MSEALILESVNPQYDDRLFIEREKYKFRTCCVQKLVLFLFWHSKQFLYTTCSELVFFQDWTCNSMNNLLSYCGLTHAIMSASEKDLPVPKQIVDCSYVSKTSVSFLTAPNPLLEALLLFQGQNQIHSLLELVDHFKPSLKLFRLDNFCQA